MSGLSASFCVSVPAVIAAIDRLPTRRAELLVLEYLLRRRTTRGTSIEKLYASLLSRVMSEQHKLPDLNDFLPKTPRE
jgi:hypothetical protein